VSQLGNNFVVYGIRVAREDIEARLSSASPAELRMKPMDWLAQAYEQHPKGKRETHTAWAGRLSVLMRDAPVTKWWQPDLLNRRLYDLEKNERERIVRERAARERTARGRRRD